MLQYTTGSDVVDWNLEPYVLFTVQAILKRILNWTRNTTLRLTEEEHSAISEGLPTVLIFEPHRHI